LLLNINRQPDGNTVQVATSAQRNRAHSQTLATRSGHQPFYDQSIIVGDSINRYGMRFCSVWCSLRSFWVAFLGDWRTSIVAGLVIPVTVM